MLSIQRLIPIAVIAMALLPGMADASLHASPAGVAGLLAVALAAVLSPPLLAILTARSGERMRDLRIAAAIWLLLNVTSCIVPTGKYGGVSDLIRFQRFKYLAIAYAAGILAFRLYQLIRRKLKSKSHVATDEGG